MMIAAQQSYASKGLKAALKSIPPSNGELVAAGDEQDLTVDTYVPSAKVSSGDPVREARRQELGQKLWDRYLEGTVELYPVQVSGRNDGADARSNVADTAAGRVPKLSSYKNAPGGRVPLSMPLLEGLASLSDDFGFRLTALNGGSHSRRSRHYLGVALDIDKIDGKRVNIDHPRFRALMEKARKLGATEVLGPGDRGHATHLHIAWPRNAAG